MSQLVINQVPLCPWGGMSVHLEAFPHMHYCPHNPVNDIICPPTSYYGITCTEVDISKC